MSRPFYETCRPRSECSLCRSGLLDLCARLPNTPLANDFRDSNSDPNDRELFPLAIVMCRECYHVQLSHLVDPGRLFGAYLYETGTSPQTLTHLQKEANAIVTKSRKMIEELSVLEIGSNDGSLLKIFVQMGVKSDHVIGIEPSSTMTGKAIKDGIPTLQAFFGPGIERALKRDWDVVVANNVLAHVPSVRDVLETAAKFVAPTGFLVMEVGNAADIMKGAFDVIYHEHMSYHSLAPLRRALEDVGLPMFDVEKSEGEVGRGSLRVWAGRGRSPSKRMLDELDKEESLALDDPRLWRKRLERRKGSLVGATANAITGYFTRWKRTKEKPVIAGFGAPAKLTTLTYACDVPDVVAIGEDSSWKIGKLTPGRRISIVSRKDMLAMRPDSIIVYAWNFADQIAKELKIGGYRGEIYVPLPESRVISP